MVGELQQVGTFWAAEANGKTSLDSRLVEVFEKQVERMCQLNESSTGESVDLQIASIETISDFDGNEYTLVECAPTGYMIYHNASGVFVEYSPVTNSPYYNAKEEGKYVGPNAYYLAKGNETYIDVLKNKQINASQVASLQNTSEKINNELAENRNIDILNYIEGNTNISLADIYEQSTTYASTRTVSENDGVYVEGYEFFSELIQCGYIDGGKCGYIAAAMLLTYDAIVHDKNTMPLGYYNESEHSLSPRLATRLYELGVELGHSAGTSSIDIHDTVKEWLTKRALTVNHISLYLPTYSTLKIKALIDRDRPVIWFGAITDNNFDHTSSSGHAVVIYGYVNNGIQSELVAHFGWNGATGVYFSGILGSMYSYVW